VLVYEDAEPLPSMFRQWHATSTETKPCRSNVKARFSPYIIALVLLGIAPAQAALLTSSFPIDTEEAFEEVWVLAKQGTAELAALLAMPLSEAAIGSRSQPLASPNP
jgi:hypothetical protein